MNSINLNYTQKFFTRKKNFLKSAAERLGVHIQSVPVKLPSLGNKTLQNIVAYTIGYDDSAQFKKPIEYNDPLTEFDEDLDIKTFLRRREGQCIRLKEAIAKFTNKKINSIADEDIRTIINNLQPTANDPYIPLHLTKDISENSNEIIQSFTEFYLNIAHAFEVGHESGRQSSVEFFEVNINEIIRQFCLLNEFNSAHENKEISDNVVFDFYEKINNSLMAQGNNSASDAVDLIYQTASCSRFRKQMISEVKTANYRLSLIRLNYYDLVVRLLRDFIFYAGVSTDNAQALERLFKVLVDYSYNWTPSRGFFHSYPYREPNFRVGSNDDIKKLESFFKLRYLDTFKGNSVDKVTKLHQAFEEYITTRCFRHKIPINTFVRKYPSLLNQEGQFYEGVNLLKNHGESLLLNYVDVCSQFALENKKNRIHIDKILTQLELSYNYLINDYIPGSYQACNEDETPLTKDIKPILLTDVLEPHSFLKNEPRSQLYSNLQVDLIILLALSFCSFDMLQNINHDFLTIKNNRNYIHCLKDSKSNNKFISTDLNIAKDILSKALKITLNSYSVLTFENGSKNSPQKNYLFYGLFIQELISIISNKISKNERCHTLKLTKGEK